VAAYLLACSPLAGAKDTIDYLPLGPGLVNHVLYLCFAVLAVAPLTVPHTRHRVLEGALANPAMRFLGRISYGVFLWHVVMQYVYHQFVTGIPFGTGSFTVELAAVLAGSIAAATISYRLVERPAMSLRPWLGKAPPEPGVATVTP
jgi:peptidoglycan/LPS O-acetylase OafA/YrhL